MSIADEQLPEMPDLEPGVYEHYKGGRYEVIAVVLHTETLEILVVYKPLYETKIPAWSRPYDMFVDTVVVDGNEVPRFRKVGILKA